jgi:hypothetical protein
MQVEQHKELNMVHFDKRVAAFVKLGKFLKNTDPDSTVKPEKELSVLASELAELIQKVHIHNPWFTEENVRHALAQVSESLDEQRLVEWLSAYVPLKEVTKPKTVAVIMAGNVPAVGFHDLLCVVISGHTFLGKLSSEDKYLLPFIAKVLCAIEPGLAEQIQFTDGQLKGMDAVIATGSNNTARYFDYYFGKYPHIIRRNRNSVAVLTGQETGEQLNLLGKDLFLYFGLGCRNVSKLFVPENYKFDKFYEAIFSYADVVNNNKYGNNYDYNKTVYLMGSQPDLLDNNFLLLKRDEGYSSPIGVLFYETYKDLSSLKEKLTQDEEQIQCVVSSAPELPGSVGFGESQCPRLSDYADGVDTMKFLQGLS